MFLTATTYAGRNTVNQVAKVAPGVIKAATNDINDIAKDRINQIIARGGKEVERVLPTFWKTTIEQNKKRDITLKYFLLFKILIVHIFYLQQNQSQNCF